MPGLTSDSGMIGSAACAAGATRATRHGRARRSKRPQPSVRTSGAGQLCTVQQSSDPTTKEARCRAPSASSRRRKSEQPFALQNSKLLKVSLDQVTIQAKLGSMVAYQGEVSFEHAGSGGHGPA